MAAGGARNMACMQLIVPPCPLSDAPYPVLMKLARSIDTVNNNHGHGCMILADLLGCSSDDIRSIMTRAERDFRNGFSPTMILFNDLKNQYSPAVTLRDIEKALLKMNLEAVNVLYNTENHLKIQRAYCEFLGFNNSIDINTENSICNCFNCLRDNSNMQHNQSFNNGVSHPNVSQRQHGFLEVSRAGNPRRMPANAPDTIQDDYVGSDICQERPVPPHSAYYFTTNESGCFEHQPHSERIHAARGTLSPLFISPDRVERGPSIAPPCIQSQEERNVHVMRRLTRQISEYQQCQRICAERTVPRDLSNEVTECICPEDSVDNEEDYCTCGITSSKSLHSGMPGNNQGQQLTSQHLHDETFVKSPYDQGAVDYSECTCHSQADLQNNNILLNNNMDNKRSLMDETKTKAFCDKSNNGSCLCSLIPCQTGPDLSVFVTYSRHSLEHVQEVIELCKKLKGYGIRVRVDFSGDKALDLFQNKYDWLDANLKIARYVIVCISPTYCEDAALPCNTKPIPDVQRLDVRYIYDHLRTEYHKNCSQNMRVIPVIFEKSGANRKHLPVFMATTYVYTYPRQVDSIIEFIRRFTPPVR